MSADTASGKPPKRSRLAIAIPAYGRATAIAGSVAAMAEEACAEGLDVVFHVSDDTPDTTVIDALRPLIAAGLPIHYRQNTPALRHDRNLIATLLWPDADYVWLLGSGFRVRPGQLVRAYRFLEGQDLVFVNVHIDDYRTLPRCEGEEARSLLRDKLWHQTLTGATIYAQSVRDWVVRQGAALHVAPDFPQVSVILGYASDTAITIGWFGEPSLQSSGSDTASYWQSKAVEVFVDHWSAAVAAFPKAVPPDQRAHIVREHSARTDLFNTTNLIGHRQTGQFNWRSLTRPHFREAMHLPLWKLIVLAALPVPVLRQGGAALGNAKRLLGRK